MEPLWTVGSTKEYVEWLRKRGITPGENKHAGTVFPVHTGTNGDWGSLHYRTVRDGRIVVAEKKLVTHNGRQIMTPQGDLALDINDNDVRDDKFRRQFRTESEALTFLYHRTVAVFGPDGYDVLDEAFHGGFGFLKEDPDRNHPISGHATHFHAGFKQRAWHAQVERRMGR